MIRRPPNPEEDKLLNEMARAVDPSREARDLLRYKLETDPVARDAFIARHLENERFVAAARAAEDRLPFKLRASLPARVKTYHELVAIAERKGEPAPELVLTPDPETTA